MNKVDVMRALGGFLCFAALAAAAAGPAAYPGTTNHRIVAVPANGAVSIDGDLGDWDRSGEILICDNLDLPRQAMRMACMHDEQGLLIACRFYDPTPMMNENDPGRTPDKGWRSDALQLRFWTEPEKPAGPPAGGRIAHIDCYWSTPVAGPVAFVAFASMTQDGFSEGTIEKAIGNGVEAGFAALDDGYVQEMRIAWSVLFRDGHRGTPGEELRLGVEAMWNDDRSFSFSSTRVTDLLNRDLPQRDYFWATHQAWGTVELAAAGSLAPAPTALFIATTVAKIHAWMAGLDRAALADLPRPGTPEAAAVPTLMLRPESRLVRKWYQEGTAAGNHGDAYDNRDGGHSLLRYTLLPQLGVIEYTPEEQAQGRHYGAALEVRPGVVIGNSSTASPADRGGSHVRRLTSAADKMQLLYRQYRNSNLYVYPEHQDHDPGHNGRPFHGDLFPVNTPYLIASQGSSGSDLPFLGLWAQALAALRPEVKKRLIDEGLLMPALQQIFRSTQVSVRTEADYLTGLAHPSAFAEDQIDAERMVKAAQELTVDTLPPFVQLKVLQEDAVSARKDYLDFTRIEQIADTPGAVARVHRRQARDMHLTVSAADSFDPDGRPLRFHWVVLRGDPRKIRLEPRDGGAVAALTIAWHERFPVADGADLETNRVDIGVFAHNGVRFSPPSFVSVFYPDHERRAYDDQGRLLEIDYEADDARIGYPTEAVFSFGHSAYDIADFEALLRLATGGDNLPAQLLRAEMKADEQEFLLAIREDFVKQKEAWQPEWEKANAYKQMHHVERWRYVKAADEAAGAPLLRVDPALNCSAKGLLERALNSMKDSPGLFVDHAAVIQELVERPELNKAKPLFGAALDRLLIYEVLRKTEAGYSHGPLFTGALTDGTPSRFARAELDAFHLLILKEILYPGLLNVRLRANYVDDALAVSAPWCDVFLRDPHGHPNGWLRFQGNQRHRFTAAGHRILEIDAPAATAVAAGTETVCTANYVHPKTRRSIGRVVCLAEGIEAMDADGRLLVSLETGGRGVKLDQVRFVLPPAVADRGEEKALTLVDILERGDDGFTGYTRYGGEVPGRLIRTAEPATAAALAPENKGSVNISHPERLTLSWRDTDARYRHRIRDGSFYEWAATDAADLPE